MVNNPNKLQVPTIKELQQNQASIKLPELNVFEIKPVVKTYTVVPKEK